jgi:hypothetical protein
MVNLFDAMGGQHAARAARGCGSFRETLGWAQGQRKEESSASPPGKRKALATEHGRHAAEIDVKSACQLPVPDRIAHSESTVAVLA